MPRIVYLDQNIWIYLSQAQQGRNLKWYPAMRAVHEAVSSGTAVFPLSFGHHVETYRRKDARQRWRLAIYMLNVSADLSLAFPDEVVKHEIREVLAWRFPDKVPPDNFSLLGSEVWHRWGEPVQVARVRAVLPSGELDTGLTSMGQALADWLVPVCFLSGATPFGEPFPPIGDITEPARLFAKDLLEWRTHVDGRPKEFLRKSIIAEEMQEISPLLVEAFAQYGLTASEVLAGGIDEFESMLLEMPTRRLNMHLRHHLALDKTFPIDEGDLSDWAHLGIAAMYCDALVCEKQFGSLMNHSGFQSRADVIRYPEHLVDYLTT